MNIQASPGIGHNASDLSSDPLRDRLAETHADILKRRDALLDAFTRTPETVESDEVDGRMSDFVKQISACIKNAETTRTGEKEPFLAAGRTVDGFFKSVTDPLDRTKKAIETRLTVYKRQKAEAERRIREEEERQRREAAEAARREAEARIAEMQKAEDVAGAIEAERAALQAEADAAKAAKDAIAKAADLSRNRGDYGAVSSLRTFWDFDGLDRDNLDLNALRPHLPADALEKAVRSFIKAGGRDLRGVRIFENTNTVIR